VAPPPLSHIFFNITSCTLLINGLAGVKLASIGGERGHLAKTLINGSTKRIKDPNANGTYLGIPVPLHAAGYSSNSEVPWKRVQERVTDTDADVHRTPLVRYTRDISRLLPANRVDERAKRSNIKQLLSLTYISSDQQYLAAEAENIAALCEGGVK
jgi:hypothetical protein